MTKKVRCPNTKFESIKKILYCIEPEGKLTIEQIAKKTNRSISWINNALPIMGELGLIYRGTEGNIGITSKGIDLVKFLKDGNNQKIQELGEKIYIHSDLLHVAKKIFSEYPKISNVKLGKRVVDALEIPKEERWKNDTTYAMVARSCKSLLGGLKLIEHIPQKHERKNINRFRNKIMPYASTVLLDDLLKKFVKDDNDVYRLPSEEYTQYQRQRQTDYFNTAIFLGLVVRVPGNDYLYKLTTPGKVLAESVDFSQHAHVFQEILLNNSHVVEIIKTIRNNYDEISTEEIGQILNEYNGTNWGDGTKKSYGNNFLNWLREADIMIKRGRKHKYTFQPHFLEGKNYRRYISNELTKTEEIQQTTPIEQIQLVTVKQTKISNDEKLIFNYLVANLNYIEKNLSINPFADNNRHIVINDCLNQLIDRNDGELKSTFIFLRSVIDEAYKSNNKLLITACLQRLASIEDYNKSTIDT